MCIGQRSSMLKINKTYTLRFVKLPPATIVLGKPFDIIFSLTDDLGLEVPAFPDIKVAFRIKDAQASCSNIVVTDASSGLDTMIISSYQGSLHRVSLRVDSPVSGEIGSNGRMYLELNLVEQLEDSVGRPRDPLDAKLMDFVQTGTLLHLSEEEIVALVVPTHAGPLTLSAAKKGSHSPRRVNTTEVHLQGKTLLQIVEHPFEKIIGDHLWHASVILAHAILQGAQVIPKEGTVIELGSGCGLVSLAVEQALGNTTKAIWATDLSEVVETTLKDTLLTHARPTKSSVNSQELEWGVAQDTDRLLENVAERHALWIVAADVLYNPSSHEALLQTICQLCSRVRQCTVTIAYRPRAPGDDHFFELAREQGLQFRMMLELADVQIWQHANV